MRTSNGKPLGWSLMRFCTDVGTLTGSFYLGFEELSDMLPCSY
ncbi:hypothetical protein Golax_015078 [Gossypium laxum]|uniref:Uncharacterized protein n=1 Tax=Gossypium laxum TaxID=34288 RepID=A0A7J8ZWQ4_9ROSI|nr:hypothetical protein [Gossypium laxum]